MISTSRMNTTGNGWKPRELKVGLTIELVSKVLAAKYTLTSIIKSTDDKHVYSRSSYRMSPACEYPGHHPRSYWRYYRPGPGSATHLEITCDYTRPAGVCQV